MRISIHVTEDQKKELEKRAKRLKKPLSQYLKNIVLMRLNSKKIAQIEKIILLNGELILDIAGIGNNINQIAHHLNAGFTAHENEFYQQAEKFQERAEKLQKLLEANNSILRRLI